MTTTANELRKALRALRTLEIARKQIEALAGESTGELSWKGMALADAKRAAGRVEELIGYLSRK